MELTEKQQQGLEIAVARYKAGESHTVISGYAGTGKSTLVRFIIEALGVEEEQICYCAYTGKATQVLQKKGNKNCLTLHKLLYETYQLSNGDFLYKPVKKISYSLIIVDECSMVPGKLADLLLSYNVHVIFLGDPGQLPPVSSDDSNTLLDHPHIFLDQIMRQAAESEIIQISMKIRQGLPLEVFHGKEVQILHKNELSKGMLTWADQILVATNSTRNAINTMMREMRGCNNPNPQDGDKVICLHNYWDKIADTKEVLINGTIGTISETRSSGVRFPDYIGCGYIPLTKARFISDTNSNFGILGMDKNQILTGEKTLTPRQCYLINRSIKLKWKMPYDFAYAYAITYWKAQGSEWDKVLILEESFPFDKETHQRAMYTAITRAAKKCVIIKKD